MFSPVQNSRVHNNRREGEKSYGEIGSKSIAENIRVTKAARL
jgi:hypothetical protein